MSTILKSAENSEKTYEPHPAGSFMAVLADVFVKSYPNKYKGQILTMGKNKGKRDERETIEKVCFGFITEEPIEIDGQLKPRYASFWASASLGSADYPSRAREFLKSWWPTLTDATIDAGLDLDKFIGRGAYVTITNTPDRNDPSKVWAYITGAMQPPKGATIPQIPADFVRHKDKEQAPAQPAAAAPAQPATTPMPAPDLKVQPRHAAPLTAEENALPELDKHEGVDDSVNPW